MSFAKFSQITTENDEINRLQKNISKTMDDITAKAHLDSQIITGINIKPGATNNVPHLLSRKPVKCEVANFYGEGHVWQAKAADSLFVYLTSSNTLTVDIEVA